MDDPSNKSFETSMIERERWTAAILTALHEMRCASADGLSRHGVAPPVLIEDQPSALPGASSPSASSCSPR